MSPNGGPLFVLDCSVTMSWCFTDEISAYGEQVLDSLERGWAHVPSLWLLEVTNVLSLAERKGRLQSVEADTFARRLMQLPIHVEAGASMRSCLGLLHLTRSYELTSYDARYLHLASVHALPLATLDKRLRAAAHAHGVPLFDPAFDG